MAKAARDEKVLVEKAVDVMIAVDLVTMAYKNEFDAGYLLSADGDYTHAVSVARGLGKKIYGAAPGDCAQLSQVCNNVIRITPEWIASCIV